MISDKLVSPTTEPKYAYLRPSTGGRKGISIDEFLSKEESIAAKLSKEECLALRLYTGPNYTVYNNFLRNPKSDGPRWTTTIFAIVSAITKLARIWRLPEVRKVYRGLSGVNLPPAFRNEDAYGFLGGVEFGVLSCTTDRSVATDYSLSRDGQTAVLFEIECGQVDRGASLRWISQFPAENEIVMPPLSNLEAVGAPRIEWTAKGVVKVVPIRLNVNIITSTLEQLKSRRMLLHLNMAQTLKQETAQLLGGNTHLESNNGSFNNHSLVQAAMNEIEENIQKWSNKEPDWFNSDVNYRQAMNMTLDLKLGVERKYKLMSGIAVQKDRELMQRLRDTPGIDCCNEGIIYEIRSGTNVVPFTAIMNGLDVIKMPSISYHQAEVAWECIRTCDGKGGRTFEMVNPSGTTLSCELGNLISRDSCDLSNWDLGPSMRLVAPAFAQNPFLTALNLAGNHIGREGAGHLAEGLKHCSRLTSLNLYDNHLAPDSCTVLGSVLSNLTSLSDLNLVCNPIGDGGLMGLCPFFKSNTNLRSLDLSWCGFGPDGLSKLARSLQQTTGLESLELAPALLEGDMWVNSGADSDCLSAIRLFAEVLGRQARLSSFHIAGFSEDLMLPIMKTLEEKAKHLKFLAMNIFHSKGHVDPLLSPLLLNNQKSLRSITVAGSRCQDGLCHAIKACVASSSSLRSLNFTLCSLSKQCLRALAEVISHDNCGLSHWFMTGNVTEDADWNRDFFANSSLQFPSTIQLIHLVGIKLTDEGATKMSRALSDCKSLTDLDLSQNPIGGEGLKSLCKVLSKNSNLTCLKLAFCQIDKTGTEALSESLIGHSNLRQLDFTYNERFDYDAAIALAPILKTCPSLRSVTLSGCQLVSQWRGVDYAKSPHSLLRALSVAGHTKVITENIGISQFMVERMQKAIEAGRARDID